MTDFNNNERAKLGRQLTRLGQKIIMGSPASIHSPLGEQFIEPTKILLSQAVTAGKISQEKLDEIVSGQIDGRDSGYLIKDLGDGIFADELAKTADNLTDGRTIIHALGDGFALARGGKLITHLSDDDVLNIANHAENYRQTIMTRSYPHGAVYASPASSTHVQSDALGEHVLIQFGTGQSGQTVFQLEYSLGLSLLQQLLNLREPDAPTRAH